MDLLEQVRATVPPDRGIAAWWLGQAGWIFKGRSGVVVIDPFLSLDLYDRHGCLAQPPFAADQCDFATAVLGTHIHIDHIDPVGFPSLLRSSQGATAVVPAAIGDEVAALGTPQDRLRGVRADESIRFNDIEVTAFAALHAGEMEDGYGFHEDQQGRHPFLGYAISLDGVRIAHVGDTLIYDGLADRLRSLDLDLLLLPINGRSWFRERRGLVGNMNSYEAAELAELTGARLTIPMHWDLFPDNAEDPENFSSYAARRHPAARILIASRAERIHLNGQPGGLVR